MSEAGWFPMSRARFERNRNWPKKREFSTFEAEVDLLRMAAFEPHEKEVKGVPVELSEGEILISIRFLAERWMWPKSRVERWLIAETLLGHISRRRTTASGDVYLIENKVDTSKKARSRKAATETVVNPEPGLIKEKEKGASEADLELAAKAYRCFINSRANAYEHLGMKTSGAPKFEACLPMILAARDATALMYDDANERLVEAAMQVAFDPYAMGKLPKFPGVRFKPEQVFNVNKNINNIVKLSDARRSRPEEERDIRPEDLEDFYESKRQGQLKLKVAEYDASFVPVGDHVPSL